MIVYKSSGQEIEDNSVIRIRTSYGFTNYIVTYDMRICCFILFPLEGITLPVRHLGDLDEVTTDWEFLGHIGDDSVISQLNVQEGIPAYLDKVYNSITIK